MRRTGFAITLTTPEAGVTLRLSAIALACLYRGLLVVLAAVVVMAASDVTPALGHGPCRCLDPRLAEAGSHVRVGFEVGVGETRGRGYPAYRVIFNPRPRDLGIAPRLLASAYRADVPTTTVLSRPRNRPTRRGRFRIPAGTPPGVYMMLIFDGSEGGAHNSWEYLHVIDPGQATGGVVARSKANGDPVAATRRNASDDSVGWWIVLGSVALGCLVAGVALTWRRGRHRR